MQKKILLAAILVILSGAVWYYYDIMQENSAPTTVVVSSVSVPDLDFLFAVMKDKGFAKNNNIELRLVLSNPGEAERKLAYREAGIDVAVFNPIALVRANEAKNIQLRAFAPLFDTFHSILVKKDSAYQTLADLKGKKLAIRPQESAAYNATAIAMRVAGLDIQKDFRITFTDIPGSIGLLNTGDVDATLVPTSATVNLLASGKFRSIEKLDENWHSIANAQMPFIDFAAHKDWLEANKKVAYRFRKMFLESAEYIRDNPDVINEYKDMLGIKNDEGLRLMKERLPLLYPTSWNDSAHTILLQKAADLKFIKSVPGEYYFE